MRHPHVRVGITHDLRQVTALLLLREDDLHAEQVAVEAERALEVADGETGVQERRHQNVIETPPSTVMTCPVRYEFCSEHSHAACAAISAGSAARRNGSLRCST